MQWNALNRGRKKIFQTPQKQKDYSVNLEIFVQSLKIHHFAEIIPRNGKRKEMFVIQHV